MKNGAVCVGFLAIKKATGLPPIVED